MQTATTLMIAILVGIGILAVALVDYATGDEVLVLPLYFLPLVMAGWYFPRRAALLAAVLVTIAWAVTLYLGGHRYSEPYIWITNFLAQGVAFIAVTLLAVGLRNAFRRKRELKSIDSVTGLANSQSFFERAGSVLAVCHRNTQPATLAYIDLDNLKNNAALGHQKSDALLRKVADVLNDNLRASDVAARIGSDEFVVLLPETTEATAQAALDKVHARLTRAEDFQASDVIPRIGAVTCTPAPPDINRMIKAADKVMRRVKAASTNRVFVQGMDPA